MNCPCTEFGLKVAVHHICLNCQLLYYAITICYSTILHMIKSTTVVSCLGEIGLRR